MIVGECCFRVQGTSFWILVVVIVIISCIFIAVGLSHPEL